MDTLMDCRMLFPFEHVRQGSRVLIYGAGVLGESYLEQIKLTNYCQLIGFIDRNYDKYANSQIPVYSVKKIKNIEYDYIVIALRNKHFYDDVFHTLTVEYGVDTKKIVAVFFILPIDISSCLRPCEENAYALAYDKSDNNIAFFISGGMGDCIIQKSFITAIIKQNKKCMIDIYSLQAKSFLKNVYSDRDTYICNMIYDSGAVYLRNKTSYALAITLKGTFVEIDHYNREAFLKIDTEFSNKIDTLVYKINSEKTDRKIPAIVEIMRRVFLGKNCYTGFECGGIFYIDRKVELEVPQVYKTELQERLGDNLFVTINTANGDSSNNNLIAKTWSIRNYNALVDKFKNVYKNINIVQIGSKDAPEIDNTDYCILGERLDFVKAILQRSLLHIDIEGGLVHLATQLGTKCVVLFGPTMVEYYGYKENINIIAGNCHGCYGLFEEINKCARDMKEPECMYSITPELVFREVENYLKTVSYN